jgi:hypothetical protein
MRPQELVASLDAQRWAGILAVVREHDKRLWTDLQDAAIRDQRIPPKLWQRFKLDERGARIRQALRAPEFAPLGVAAAWAYLRHTRAPLLDALREALALPDLDALTEGPPLAAPDDATLDTLLHRLLAEFPFADLTLCLHVLVALDRTRWPALEARLAEWDHSPPPVARLAAPAPADPAPSSSSTATSTPPPAQAPAAPARPPAPTRPPRPQPAPPRAASPQPAPPPPAPASAAAARVTDPAAAPAAAAEAPRPGRRAAPRPLPSSPVARNAAEPREAPVGPAPVPAPAPPPAARQPGPSALTPLDRLVEDAIVGALTGTLGAPSEADARAIVTELLQLNAQRAQSGYHLGLLETLSGVPLAIDRRGWSPARTAWYHYGRLAGWQRQGRWAEIARFYTEEREAAYQLVQGGDALAPWAASLLFQALQAAEAPALAADLVRHFTGGHAPLAYCHELLDAARVRLQEDRVPEALAILDALQAVQPLADASAALHAYQARLRRLQAQCDLARGLFRTAFQALEAELAQAEGLERAALLGELGLAAAELRRLGDVRLPEAENDPEAWLRKLERGVLYFAPAVELAPAAAPTSSFCLAVIHWLRHEHGQARSHFEAALQAMQAERALYTCIGVYSQVQFYLGASLLLDLDAPARDRALQAMREALAAGLRPGAATWRRLLELVALDPSLADPLSALVAAEPTALPRELRLEYLLQCAAHSATARRQLAAEARRPDLPALQRWELLTHLLAAQRAAGEHEAMSDTLDALERLAHTPSEHARALLERWRELLAAPAQYQPAWSWEDALWSRVHTLELLGRDDEAFSLLELLFPYRLNEGTPEGLAEAESILARARGLASSPEAREALHDMQRRLRQRQEAERPDVAATDDRIAAALRAGHSLRVLFVGGNETQAQYESALRQKLERRDPNTGAEVSLRFIMPGFNSNWDKTLDQVRTFEGRCDALVLMPFVRTELGRALRKLASQWDIPWLPCTGKGADSLERALRQALDWAAQRALARDRSGR